MDHFHRRSSSNPTTTFSLLETPPVSIRSSIPTMSVSTTANTTNSTTTHQQPHMSTFGQHQLTVQQPPPPPPPASSQKPAHANTFVHKLYK